MKRSVLYPWIYWAAFACVGMGCSSNDAATPASTDAGGPASGPADDHCALPDGGALVQAVDPAACSGAPMDTSEDGGMDMSGGGGDMEMTVASDYGDPMYGASGDDDDCKYHVAWSAGPISRNVATTLTVSLVAKASGQAVGGAEPYADVTLGDTHAAPGTGQTSVEGPPGTYKIGPIVFDEPGLWTVRFHFFETCADTPDSPHGHAAFYVSIP